MAIGAFLLANASAGCDRAHSWSSFPARRPLGADLATITAGDQRLQLVPPGGPRRPAEPRGNLTLDAALALALSRSPDLAGVAWSVREAEAQRLQAGLHPNPWLLTESGDFAGSGEAGGITAWFGHPIETAGKRRKRRVLAGWDAKLAGWNYEARRLDLFASVTDQFVEVLADQQRLALARKAVALTEATLDAATKRVAAGKAAPAARIMAAVKVTSERISVIRAESRLKAARQALVALWGGARPRFERAIGSLERMRGLPSKALLIASLPQSPRMARWNAEIQRRQADLELQRARAVPDWQVGLGYSQTTSGSRQQTGVALFEVPLPVYDRNQGAIRRARLAVYRARAERAAAEAKMRSELENAYQALAAAHAEAVLLRDEILPATQTSHEASRESYHQGKTDHVHLFRAQRMLITTRRQHVDALALYHKAVAAVEVLTGRPLTPAAAPTPKRKDRADAKNH